MIRRKRYIVPCANVKRMAGEPLLAASTITLPANPGDGTDEALSKENSIWSDTIVDDEDTDDIWDDEEEDL